MNKTILLILVVSTMSLVFNAEGQEWKFIKEKGGIKIYTRKEEGNSLKSFRGVTDIRTTMDKVRNLIGNVRNVDWWDKNVKELKILAFEKEKYSRYYIIYDSPWPVADRDLCVEATITNDPVTGRRMVSAKPLLNVVPEREDAVRIRNYWQRWILEPGADGTIHAILEGYVDPGGSVPDWIYNMVITDTPLKVMRGVKERLEK
jgi:hypothetical protein